MTTPDKDDKPSEWTRLPLDNDAKSSGSARVRGALEHGAGHVAEAIEDGMRTASDAFAAPGSAEVEELMKGSDLPELDNADVLLALGRRLDREGDFWRALALKALGRAAWADRTAHLTSVVVALCCASLAGVAGLEAVFGGAVVKAALVAVGTGALLAGAGMVAWVSSRIGRSQQAVAREALARADLSEIRLHRLAVVMAIRSEDRASLPDALKRLERETSSPVR